MQPERPNPTILEYVEVVARHRFTVLLATFSAACVAALLAFLMPKTYTARASVLPERAATGSSLPMSGMLQTIGDLAPGYSFSGLERSSPVRGLLESRTLVDRVVLATDLLGGEPVSRADTLAALESAHRKWARRIRVDADDDTGVIAIEVDAPDRMLAARIANTIVSELNRLNLELAYSAASASRAFTETRLVETRDALRRAQEELVAFQDAYGAIALDEQAGETVKELAKLEGEIISLRAAREAASVNYTASLSTVRQLDAQIDVLVEQKRRMLGTRPPDTAPGLPDTAGAGGETDAAAVDGALLPLRRVPALSARYANLLLDVKIQESVLTVLHQQLEQSKIEEARDVPIIQVLDRATPPVRHARPRRSLMLVVGAVAGAMTGLVLVAAQEWMARNESEAGRLRRAVRGLAGHRS